MTTQTAQTTQFMTSLKPPPPTPAQTTRSTDDTGRLSMRGGGGNQDGTVSVIMLSGIASHFAIQNGVGLLATQYWICMQSTAIQVA